MVIYHYCDKVISIATVSELLINVYYIFYCLLQRGFLTDFSLELPIELFVLINCFQYLIKSQGSILLITSVALALHDISLLIF